MKYRYQTNPAVWAGNDTHAKFDGLSDKEITVTFLTTSQAVSTMSLSDA